MNTLQIAHINYILCSFFILFFLSHVLLSFYLLINVNISIEFRL